MSDNSKKPILEDLSGADLDPDATAVVDARSVWAALEREDKGLGLKAPSVVPKPPVSVRPPRPKEEEEVDLAWEDFDLVEEPEPAPPSASGEDPRGKTGAPTAPPPSQPQIPEPPPTSPVALASGPLPVFSEEPPSPRAPSPSSIVTPAFGVEAVAEPRPAPKENEAPKRRSGPSAVEMDDRFSMGDYTGAMEIAEELLSRDPDHSDARECIERSRAALRAAYTAKLGSLDRVPVLAIAREQLRWLTIDHRAGFILSHVDGMSNLEEIVDVSGMPELDALRILSELVEQRIIAIR
ncbi:MAG: hypothetical protein U0183_00550 [Polyangiaceae bacterium]